jgi:multidrug efflux pump subunit AcrA (membrane-fusion protein)
VRLYVPQRHGPVSDDPANRRIDREAAARKAAELAAAGRKAAAAEAAKAQLDAAKAQKDRVKALRAAGPNKPKVLSPLVVAKMKRDEERARAKAEMAALKVRKRLRAQEVDAPSSPPRPLAPPPPLLSCPPVPLQRQKHLEKERASEARERAAMFEEEWHQERVKWSKVWGGRDGSWRTVRVFISSTFTDM